MAHPLRSAPLHLATALASLSLTTSLFAQPAPTAAPAAPLEPPTTPTTPPTPPTITVDDPLLAPIPAAPKILATWQDAVHLVDTRSTDLRIAEEDVARAEAQSRQALGRILPTLNGSASAGRNSSTTDQPAGSTLFGQKIDQPFTQTNTSVTTSVGATLSVPILQPRGWYAYGSARQSVELAKLSTIDRRRLLITNVASAIVSVFTAERVAEINRVGLKTALERLELTRRRARLGTATRLDVVRAEQDLTLATNTIIQGNESLRRSREALGIALGEDVPYGVAPSISLNAIETSVRSMCRVGKPEERADVRAIQQQLELNRRQVTETRLGFLPTASIDASLSTSTSQQSVSATLPNFPPQDQPTNRAYIWSIRAVINIPLFEGSRYGELALNRATRDQQEVRLEAATRQARLEVAQANRGVEVAEQSRANSESARDLAKETARLTQVAYEAGTATSFELIDAARRQRETELDLVVREFELLRAKIAALLAAAVCEE
jgi:outer membrane protein TolC